MRRFAVLPAAAAVAAAGLAQAQTFSLDDNPFVANIDALEIAIPTPGALLLLALSGPVAIRRRRH